GAIRLAFARHVCGHRDEPSHPLHARTLALRHVFTTLQLARLQLAWRRPMSPRARCRRIASEATEIVLEGAVSQARRRHQVLHKMCVSRGTDASAERPEATSRRWRRAQAKLA